MTVWFDTHAHIQDRDFARDFDAVLQRAREQGVTRILLAASNERDSRAGCRLAADHPMLYAAVGVHPHDAKTWDRGMGERLRQLIRRTNDQAVAAGRDRPVVAVGETGLDFYRDLSPRDVQRRVFLKQLELAHQVDLPVIIHIREATAAALEILQQAHSRGLFSTDQPAGVIHCYSDSADRVGDFLDLGFMIGFDGPITFDKAHKARAALAAVPLDRLVLETDAPWLSPAPYRGKRNEPAYLPLIGEEAARTAGIPLEEMARRTTENALRLFRIE